MKAKEFIKEISFGDLPNPNIPDFSNPTHECDVDIYQIMSAVWKGHYVLGILDENNQPKSYCILEPENNGYNRFVEIHTLPGHTGQNLAATLLLSLKKMNIKLLINQDDVISDNGRKLILAMVKNGRLNPSLMDGTELSYNDLKNIFDIPHSNKYAIVLEGMNFMNQERRYRKDEVLSGWTRLCGEINMKRELYED